MQTPKYNFDEGLGTVYERFMLNDFFDDLFKEHSIGSVIEVPIYGMSGLTGINSIHLSRKGCRVSLLGDEDHIREARDLWQILGESGEFFQLNGSSSLPFTDRSFDLAWNFAAIWHHSNPGQLLKEMARVSDRFVLIFVPNKLQLGYFTRKYLFDKDFFNRVKEEWVDAGRIRAVLEGQGLRLLKQGALDIPPWPDTCVPIKDILRSTLDALRSAFNISRTSNGERRTADVNRQPSNGERRWVWDIMSYYKGENLELKDRIERLTFIERSPLPWRMKLVWAHHRYLLFGR